MFIKLIATVALAFCVTGIFLFLDRFVLKGRMPKILLPAGIAFVILAYHIFDEYDWMRRETAGLGAQFVIVAEQKPKSILRPWSYINPPTRAYLTYNREKIETHGDGVWSGYLLSEAVGGKVTTRAIAVDCNTGSLGEFTGDIAQTNWNALPEDWIAALCPN